MARCERVNSSYRTSAGPWLLLGIPTPIAQAQRGRGGAPGKLLHWSPSSLSTTIPPNSHPIPGAGVTLSQESTRERGHLRAPTHDPTLHFGPKLGLGRQGLAGTGRNSPGRK